MTTKTKIEELADKSVALGWKPHDKYSFGWTDPRSTFSVTPATMTLPKIHQEELEAQLFQKLLDTKVLEMAAVGSRVTCNPAPTDTDEDILILTEDVALFLGDALEAGFSNCGFYVDCDFISLRKGEINLIVTEESSFYNKFILATHVCKALNLLDKEQRITVFQAILYEKEYGKP